MKKIESLFNLHQLLMGVAVDRLISIGGVIVYGFRGFMGLGV